MQIASYYASLGIKVDAKQMAKVDRMLKLLETKLQRFGKKMDKSFVLNISNVQIDQKLLRTKVQASLDVASKTTVLPITNFVIDQGRLNKQIRQAFATASHLNPIRPDIRPINRPRVNPRTPGESMGVRGRHIAAAGGIGGLAARAYAPVLALAAGGYGLSALNQRNQQVVAAQLQTQAVVQQAGGTAQQGMQSFDWLRAQGQRVGFNYLEAAPDFSKLLSGLTGAGFSVNQGQDVYKGFAELARVNKLDRVQQQRVFRALSQVAGKGRLQSEELVGQLAESLPGAVALFARAYQQQIGGNLTGQAAISALQAAMKKGQVNAGVLLPAATLASQQAQPGLSAASRASQAEQARFQNMQSDLAIIASQSGVESGYARLFRTLSDGLKESTGLVKTLAGWFDEATIRFRELALIPQSINRALEGRDSVVADWLGAEKVGQLKETFQTIEVTFNNMSRLVDNIKVGWQNIFEVALKMEGLTTFQRLSKIAGIGNAGLEGVNALAEGDTSTAGNRFSEFGKSYLDYVTTLPRAIPNYLTGGAVDRFFGFDQESAGLNPYISKDNMLNLIRPEYNPAFTGYDPVQQMQNSKDSNTQFNITIQVDAATLQQMDVNTQAQSLADQFKMNLTGVWSDLMINHPQTE